MPSSFICSAFSLHHRPPHLNAVFPASSSSACLSAEHYCTVDSPHSRVSACSKAKASSQVLGSRHVWHEYIMHVSRYVTIESGSCCSCTFPRLACVVVHHNVPLTSPGSYLYFVCFTFLSVNVNSSRSNDARVQRIWTHEHVSRMCFIASRRSLRRNALWSVFPFSLS